MAMLFITDPEELKTKSRYQALYFYAGWMPFHSKMMTMISKLESDVIPFFAIDVDQFPTQCKRYKIESIPQVLVLDAGKEIARTGSLHTEQVAKTLGIYGLQQSNNTEKAK